MLLKCKMPAGNASSRPRLAKRNEDARVAKGIMKKNKKPEIIKM